MKIRNIIAVLGNLFTILGLFLILPLLISLFQHDTATPAFLFSIAVATGVGLLMQIRKPRNFNIQRWEAMVIVVIGWIGASVIGALPFYFSGYFDGFINALFESVSGFTTTGASILNDIESLPISLLVWRTLTHWIGGMGIIILALVVLPAINISGRNLYSFESSSLANEQITPKIKDTARLLWTVYFILTVSETVLLLVLGLPFFDAVLTAMATIATGGFSPKNASIAAYNNVYVEIVVVIFMILSGINFTLYLRMFQSRKNWRDYSETVYIYFAIMAVASLVIVINLRSHTYNSWSEAIRYGVFQAVSINTTTGFVTTDWDIWQPVAHIVLLILMLVGACPGSTCGAIKNSRIVLLIKSIHRELIQIIHPRVVTTIHFNKRPIDEKTIQNAIVYIGMYLCFWLVASMIVALGGVAPESALIAVATTLGGVGPGIGLFGPIESYAALSVLNKIVLMASMLFGRLEFYSILIVFLPTFWQRAH
ncbi:MAG TPA: TrkH family potassium uptake protein [Candidatus Marinimicrobia bacterium]|nr:TrkH family potassium uptake protein [Candidatus Neomarinimicrobiota bacterium]HRD17826.1 TrkH family potassium uptake protein [Candidatus Neomarinimicrobiota bacterium]